MRGVTLQVLSSIFRQKISTHTPHARRDLDLLRTFFFFARFQLTRLMRGVTKAMETTRKDRLFQLTRLMRGVTDFDTSL